MQGVGLVETRMKGFVRKTTSGLARIGHAWNGLNAIVSATKILTGPLKLAANVESLSVQFRVLLGDADAAKKVLGDITEFASTTPFQKDDLVQAGRSLLAFGTAADDVVGDLRMLGDISAGVGVNIGELAQIYGKARVQGRLFAEDVNQLTGRGIPVIQEFARQFGVADSEVKKLVEQGKIGFPQLQEAMRNLTGEGGRFQNMTKELSDTAAGRFSTLKDNVLLSLTKIGEALMKEFDLKQLTSDLTEFAKTFASDWVPAIADGLKTVAAIAREVGKVIGLIADGFELIQNTAALINGEKFQSAGGIFAAAGAAANKSANDESALQTVKDFNERKGLGALRQRKLDVVASRKQMDQFKNAGGKVLELAKSTFVDPYKKLFGGLKGAGEQFSNLGGRENEVQDRILRTLEEGSQESFEVLRAAFGGGNSDQQKQLKAQKQLLDEAKKQTEKLKMIANAGGNKMIVKAI